MGASGLAFFLVVSLIFELQAFEWFDKVGEWERHFKTWERYLVIYLGSAVMWILGKSLKKKYQLKEDVRESLYDDVNFWMKSLRAKGTPFMGGEQPGNNFIRYILPYYTPGLLYRKSHFTA